MIKKLFSHTAIYGLAPQIPKVAGVFALPFITPYLTALDFGVSGIITATAGVLAVFSTLGLRVVLVNSFYKNAGQYKWAWRQIYGFLTLWNIPYALLVGTIIYFFIPKEARNNEAWIILFNVLPIVFFGPTSTLASTYYQLKQKPFQIALRTTIFGFLAVLLNVYFIAVERMGYMGWFLSTCIVSMLSNISFWLPLNIKYGFKPIFNFKWRLIKRYLAISLPTVPHYYSSYLLNTSDRVVMKLLNVNTGDIGLYNVAYTVGNLMNSFGMASTMAVGPMLNEAFKKENDVQARDFVFVQQIISLTITFVVCLWLKEVFQLLIQEPTLQNVYPLGIIIVMSYNYRPMYTGANSKLFYMEKTGLLLRVTFIAGITNVVLNLILVTLFGYEAAAYTTFITFMYMGYAGFFFKVFKEFNHANYYPLHWLSGTILITIFVYYLVELNVPAKSIMSVSAIFLAYYLISRINDNLIKHTRDTVEGQN